MKLTYISDIDKDMKRLDKFLSSKITDLSRGQIQQLIKKGSVLLNGKAQTDCSYKLFDKDEIEISYDLKSDFPSISIEAEEIPLNIVYEDDYIIVLNKQAGITVHPAIGSYSGTLVNALMNHTNGNLADKNKADFRPGIVHRIDKETSGLLVIAKTNEALINLQKQFEHHSIHRVYTAICFGKPKEESGRIETLIGKSYKNPQKQSIIRDTGYLTQKQKVKNFKNAITNYELKALYEWGSSASNSAISVINCKLETGRTHQIRVHLTSIGMPIIGDKLYGNSEKRIKSITNLELREEMQKIERQMLHAKELGFIHPITNEKLFFTSNLPDDMQDFINFLKNM